MGLLSFGSKLVRATSHAALSVARSPVAQMASNAVLPGSGIALGALGKATKLLPASKASSLGGGMGSLPALNLGGGQKMYAFDSTSSTTGTSSPPGWGSVPGIPAATGGTATKTPVGRKRLEDLNTRDLQAMDAAGERIPAAACRVYRKSPNKKYVILHDSGGGIHCLRKDIARQYGWKPGHKPLLSVGETNAIKKAGRAIDKFFKGEKLAAHAMKFKSHVLGHHRRSGGGYEIVAKPSGEIVIPKKGK